ILVPLAVVSNACGVSAGNDLVCEAVANRFDPALPLLGIAGSAWDRFANQTCEEAQALGIGRLLEVQERVVDPLSNLVWDRISSQTASLVRLSKAHHSLVRSEAAVQPFRGDGHLQELVCQGSSGGGGNFGDKRRNGPQRWRRVKPRGEVADTEIEPGQQHLVDVQQVDRKSTRLNF